MKAKPVSVSMALAIAVAAAACQKSSPTRPSDTAADVSTPVVADAKAGITITAPQLVTPADGQRFRFTDQQLTLTIKNAAATGSAAVTYTFQVATDAAFGSVVFTKDGVAEGNGQTSLTIDRLPGNKDYFWRARANAGSLAGPFAKARSFNIGPEVVLQAPEPAAPANNGQAGGATLSLTVANAGRSGPVGQLVYRFEVSDTSSFGSTIATATVPEQAGGQTTAQIDARLTSNAVYYWRAQATDPASGVVGPFSPVWSFKYVPFDLRAAIMLNSPQDFWRWDEAAKITRVTFTGEAFLVVFDKRQGPGKWPETVPPGWKGGIQYTLGMCVNPRGNQWYCSGVVQFWDGRELEASTPPSYVGRNWFYDGRWAPILGYNPSDGETVGLFVGSGNLRDGQNLNLANCPRVCERSNIQMVTWQNSGFANYVYSLARTIIPTIR